MRHGLPLVCLLFAAGCGYTERPVLDGVLLGEDGRILTATPHNVAAETARRLDSKLQRLIEAEVGIASTVSGTPVYDPGAEPLRQWQWRQATVTLRLTDADRLAPGMVGSLATAAENYMRTHMVDGGVLRVRVLTTDANSSTP